MGSSFRSHCPGMGPRISRKGFDTVSENDYPSVNLFGSITGRKQGDQMGKKYKAKLKAEAPTESSEPALTETPAPTEQTQTEQGEAQGICPACGVVIRQHRCRLCGATQSINQVSGQVIWMRNGRIVEAFQDSKRAWTEMAIRYGIPKDEWPEKFRS